ncbi:MAG: hypothetical protein HY678_01240 [Chloroflexi bacterium]|nr:hypothetical protein [Chloroflexota bacterium]
MAYQWVPKDYETLPPIVKAARALLEDWFWAMELGEASTRLPDPRYPADIDGETADRLIAHIGREFERELQAWGNLPAAGSYSAGPGFARLRPPQRLALAQQLHSLKVQFVSEVRAP